MPAGVTAPPLRAIGPGRRPPIRRRHRTVGVPPPTRHRKHHIHRYVRTLKPLSEHDTAPLDGESWKGGDPEVALHVNPEAAALAPAAAA
ncbi:hypothetical protein O7632_05535 [Solwaraspora sp. WMMD406]|uniref:hypothetical protein n=1 Tax=Solwaraspora sp. WMMD406 TaxID=3016095 RepID=UPI0024167B3C|nr:hypothetical protein [Solwaraspora sp. WMMD406]MDG4763574.1 hypothetical protein [Solwaraspora sp. WMMD406]